MRILTISHFFESHGGGIERVAAHLCRNWQDQGHGATWAASNADLNPQLETATAVPLRCFDPLEKLTGLPMPFPSLSAMRAINNSVRAADVTVIHDALYMTSITAMIAAKRARKPSILIQHIAAIPFSNPVMQLVMWVANRVVAWPMLRAADHVVYISETTATAFANVPTKRPPHILFNGVDLMMFHDDASRDGDIIAGLNLPMNRKRALFVGRFVEKKGLKILKQLVALRPETDFIFAGQGPINPAAWEAENVHVIGPQSAGDLARLYRSADMLILPSVGEGYPLVIQEAMACGLPVICGLESTRADTGATGYLTGIDIDVSDTAATAAKCSNAITALSMSDTQRHQMSLWAKSRYSWESMAQAIAQLTE
jgi:alpha-maltose-1-phosphate synthase